jgi:hypothetical protein
MLVDKPRQTLKPRHLGTSLGDGCSFSLSWCVDVRRLVVMLVQPGQGSEISISAGALQPEDLQDREDTTDTSSPLTLALRGSYLRVQ